MPLVPASVPSSSAVRRSPGKAPSARAAVVKARTRHVLSPFLSLQEAIFANPRARALLTHSGSFEREWGARAILAPDPAHCLSDCRGRAGGQLEQLVL